MLGVGCGCGLACVTTRGCGVCMYSKMASYVAGDIADSLKTKNEKICEKFVTLYETAGKTLPTSSGTRVDEPCISEDKKTATNAKKSSVNKYDRGAQRKRKRMRKLRNDPTELSRTVFVGNIPTSTTEKNLNELFQKYGKVESVRFRSVPVPDLTTPKRVAFITRTFNSNRHNMNAFVKFKNPDDANTAQELNGFDFNGFRIRVDLLSNDVKDDYKRSIFVGNLPFDIEENALYDHFNDCGLIDGVRIIRDSKSGIGKGIGYVIFKLEESVNLALHLDGLILNGRELRISRAKQREKPKKKKRLSKNDASASEKLVVKGKKNPKRPSHFEDDFQSVKKRKLNSRDRNNGETQSEEISNVKNANGKKLRFKRPKKTDSDFQGEKYTDKRKLKLKKKPKHLKRKLAV